MRGPSSAGFVAPDNDEPAGGVVAVASDESEGLADGEDGTAKRFAVLKGNDISLAGAGEVDLDRAMVSEGRPGFTPEWHVEFVATYLPVMGPAERPVEGHGEFGSNGMAVGLRGQA